MEEFSAAVARVRDRLLSVVDATKVSEAALVYSEDDARLTEAGVVSPCVARFISAEIHPPATGKPVGRFLGVTVAPPIGTYLGSRAPEEVIGRVRELANNALAQGYFALVEGEATARAGQGTVRSFVPGRSAEELWRFWVTNMSTGNLLRTSVTDRSINQAAAASGEELWRGLRELGLAGWRRGRKTYTGRFYCEAGMLLRMLQTDRFEPGPQTVLLTVTNAWPFPEMPTN